MFVWLATFFFNFLFFNFLFLTLLEIDNNLSFKRILFTAENRYALLDIILKDRL